MTSPQFRRRHPGTRAGVPIAQARWGAPKRGNPGSMTTVGAMYRKLVFMGSGFAPSGAPRNDASSFW